jgi:hypothetical protein
MNFLKTIVSKTLLNKDSYYYMAKYGGITGFISGSNTVLYNTCKNHEFYKENNIIVKNGIAMYSYLSGGFCGFIFGIGCGVLYPISISGIITYNIMNKFIKNENNNLTNKNMNNILNLYYFDIIQKINDKKD